MIELLLSLILLFSSVPRTVDPELTAMAQQRAVATATDETFNHDGRPDCCWEVLVWNLGYASLEESTRRAVEQWRSSPDHWAILSDNKLVRIGCGHAVGPDGRNNFACILDDAPDAEPVEVVSSPKPVPVGSTPTSIAKPEVVMLPNTAMGQEGIDAP